jgi:hypothetical protein
MTETQEQYRPDANDVLMGGGGYPTAKLDKLRVWVGGKIVTKPTTRQETEFGTGKPKTFPKSGDPIFGLLVDVQTDERTDADDDGIRRLYVEGRRLKEAVRNAVTAAGASGLMPGGQLFVAWVGEEKGQGATPAKVYEARYYPPTTPVPGAQTASAGAPEPMPEPGSQGGMNVFGQPETPAPAFAQEPPAAPAAQSPQAVQSPAPMAEPAPAASMPEPGAQSPAAAQNGATSGGSSAVTSTDPTPEAIAALRAAGLDPRAVFPTYQG